MYEQACQELKKAYTEATLSEEKYREQARMSYINNRGHQLIFGFMLYMLWKIFNYSLEQVGAETFDSSIFFYALLGLMSSGYLLYKMLIIEKNVPQSISSYAYVEELLIEVFGKKAVQVLGCSEYNYIINSLEKKENDLVVKYLCHCQTLGKDLTDDERARFILLVQGLSEQEKRLNTIKKQQRDIQNQLTEHSEQQEQKALAISYATQMEQFNLNQLQEIENELKRSLNTVREVKPS